MRSESVSIMSSNSTSKKLPAASARANEVLDLLGIPAPGSFNYNVIQGRKRSLYKEHYFSAWLRQEAKLVQKETDHHHHIDNFHLSTHEPMLRKIGDPDLLPPAAASPPLDGLHSNTGNCDKYTAEMISTDKNKHNNMKLLQDCNSIDSSHQSKAAAAGPSIIPSSSEVLLIDNQGSSTKNMRTLRNEYDHQNKGTAASTALQHPVHVRKVVVVVDASAIISSSSSSSCLSSTDHLLHAPTYALQNLHLHPGDTLHFLGVLQPSFRISSQLLGYKVQINAGTIFGVKKGKGHKRRKQIETKLQTFYTDCIEKGVKLYLDVKQGKPKIVAIEHARTLGATHLVLDRGIKIIEKYFSSLDACKVIQVPYITSPTTLPGKQVTSNEYVCDDIGNSEISPETLSARDSMENLVVNDEVFTIEIATSTHVESDIQAFVYKKEDPSTLKHNTAEQLTTREETKISTASKQGTESNPYNGSPT